MFDRLDDILIHYEEIMQELGEPNVTENQDRFRKLMKEQADLAAAGRGIQEPTSRQSRTVEDSLALAGRARATRRCASLPRKSFPMPRSAIEELEQELKILLLPKDPNDDKNVIVEIRAGAGGDEAALFAAEIYRMYVHYAESSSWKVEMMESVSEIGIGGMKSVTVHDHRSGRIFQDEVRVRRPPCTACAGDRVRRTNPYFHYQP